MSKIGFIGLGIMGKPMAKQMLAKGSELYLNDVNEQAVTELAALGGEKADLKLIGRDCDVIFTMLPSGSIVRDVLFGSDGLSQYLRAGSIVIDMSSVTPVDSRYCYQELGKIGVAFLDAPVSGGEPKAIDGTLSFMVGGEQEIFDRVLPLLLQMGSSAVLVGESGSGSITKLANQIIVNLNIAALGEALVFASKAGVDPQKVFEAVRGGLAGSTVMEAKAPMIINRDFAPGGRISINRKDIRNVVDTAHELDIPVPFSAALFEVMQGLKILGLMDEDHSAIVKHFERLADFEVKRPQE